MKNFYQILFSLIAVIALSSCAGKTNTPKVDVWLTNTDESALLAKQPSEIVHYTAETTLPLIEIDASQRFQTMDGFGFTLTGGSAMVINKMSPGKKDDLLEELFGIKDNNIGISYIRISIGASDLDESPFSYIDIPEGETDEDLSNFSLDKDRIHLIPILKKILAINPNIKFMGSPWSAPRWMKTNNDTRGGSLKTKYFDLYAFYIIKYLKTMEQEGIELDAITIQNEPLHPGNNPSMYMEAKDQADFIKNHLGPGFQKEGIKTKIIIYDHNLDRIDYPISILEDTEAARYIDGSAFHLYGGTIDEMSKVHDAFPNKNLYFTEQWIGDLEGQKTLGDNLGWHMKNLIIGAPLNWSKIVLEWNLASDENWDPHTDRGGCKLCIGAITVQDNHVIRRPAYYIVAHASKFVRPGSIRIFSSSIDGLSNVAFITPNDEIVLIILNENKEDTNFSVRSENLTFKTRLNAGSAATYIWQSA